MRLAYRRALHAAMAGLALWAGYHALRYYQITYPNREHTMIPLVKNMQTFCAGRFLIDLPRGSTIIRAVSRSGAKFIAESPVTRAAFEQKIATRWAALQLLKADSYGEAYVEPSKRIEPLPDAVVFAFEHVILKFGDEPGDPHHQVEGYLWREGVLYTFSQQSAYEDDIIKTMRRLQPRGDNAIPSGPGLCTARSFVPGGASSERVEFAFQLPTRPVTEFRLNTTTVYSAESPLLNKPSRPNLAAFESDDFKSTIHRDAKRTVSGMTGDELSDGTTVARGGGYETSIDAQWDYPGEIQSSSKPNISASFGIHFDTDTPPSPWGGFPPKKSPEDIGKEEFMTLWDTILGSLRLRPGAL